jgi:site-specific recombinase XerD
MNGILQKYNLLDSFSQREVSDFIEFLITKKKASNATLKEYKKKILQISVWSEDDVKEFEQNITQFSQWKAQEW